MNCKHLYHCKCIENWEKTGGKGCPICRAPLELTATDDNRRFEQLVDFGKGVASNTEEGLTKRAAEAQAQFIKNALQEAAIHRRAAGKPALSTDEALIAASKIHDTFNDWINRSKEKGSPAVYKDVETFKAQFRSNKLVISSEMERKLVQDAVKRISDAEVKHFKARADTLRNKLSEETPSKVQRVEAADEQGRPHDGMRQESHET